MGGFVVVVSSFIGDYFKGAEIQMIQTRDVNPNLEKPTKLTVVSTKDINVNEGTAKENRERAEVLSKKPTKSVTTADIDWKKRDKIKQLAQARVAAALKRKKGKT